MAAGTSAHRSTAPSLPCGNIAPTSGIAATPVADPVAGLLYVAAFLSPAQHELFALRTVESGAVLWHRPIDPPGMDPRTQQLRSALTLANGSVYVAYGGLFGDCGSYHGWVAALAADGSGPLLDLPRPDDERRRHLGAVRSGGGRATGTCSSRPGTASPPTPSTSATA